MTQAQTARSATRPRSLSLTVRHVSHSYPLRDGPLQVLDDVAPGEFVALVGPSGCGKPTLLRLAAGLLAPVW